MKILITRSHGMVGSAVTCMLIDSRHEVVRRVICECSTSPVKSKQLIHGCHAAYRSASHCVR
jgi:hypothetical protein